MVCPHVTFRMARCWACVGVMWFTLNQTMFWDQPRDLGLEMSATVLTDSQPRDSSPEVAMIVLTYRNPDKLEALLTSIATQRVDVQCEVIVADNGCLEGTVAVVKPWVQTSALKYVPLCDNKGYAAGNNIAVLKHASAAAPWVLFLNDDIRLMPGFVQSLVDLAVARGGVSTVGGVGCRIVSQDGSKLLEAGSMLFRGANAHGYGRNDGPNEPQYLYARPVDFVSGMCLMVPRADFVACGGFEVEAYEAYYEDTDLQMHIRHDLGKEIWYQPLAVAMHAEHGSFGDQAVALMQRSAQVFRERWREQLDRVYTEGSASQPAAILRSRNSRRDTTSVLYVDQLLPRRRIGQGFTRAFDNVVMLAENGHKVTVVAADEPPAMMAAIRAGYCSSQPCPNDASDLLERCSWPCYLKMYPDAAAACQNEPVPHRCAELHFDERGRAEGRRCSCHEVEDFCNSTAGICEAQGCGGHWCGSPGGFPPEHDTWSRLQQLGVELLFPTGLGGNTSCFELQNHLASRPGYYQKIIVSRPAVFERCLPHLRTYCHLDAGTMSCSLIYDAEGLWYRRDELFVEAADAGNVSLDTRPRAERTRAQVVKDKARELGLLRRADVIFTVNADEMRLIKQEVNVPVMVLGHVLPHVVPSPLTHGERGGILFVGSFSNDMYYNGDAVWYFLKRVYPLVAKLAPCIRLTIAGRGVPVTLATMASDNPTITVVESPQTLAPLYDNTRVFIAPHLYGCGAQYKLSEAMASGIPMVLGPLAAAGIGLGDASRGNSDLPTIACVGENAEKLADCIVKVHDDPTIWQKLQREAIQFARKTHDRELYKSRIEEAVYQRHKVSG
mmetsp:Transcript_43337/g.114071  ORF Transcript_43337/g.114071 Transcript_43337/m.114071 type:complete len:837 (-) Transcript_43337:328-2838(-)